MSISLKALSQRVVIKTKTGTENSSSITDVGHFKFGSDSLQIKLKNGQRIPFNLNDVAQIYFSSTTPTAHVSIEKSISIYPNPATNVIFLNAGSKNNFIKYQLLDFNGHVIRQASTFTDSPISVADLTPGLYIIKLNEVSQKWIKL